MTVLGTIGTEVGRVGLVYTSSSWRSTAMAEKEGGSRQAPDLGHVPDFAGRSAG